MAGSVQDTGGWLAVFHRLPSQTDGSPFEALYGYAPPAQNRMKVLADKKRSELGLC